MEKNTNKNNIGGNIFSTEYNFSNVNPFSGNYDPEKTATPKPIKNPNVTSPIQNKRLNGYDSTILNNTSFEGSSSEEVNVEYRIKEKEASIRDLNEKIKIADRYGTQNEALSLKAKRQRILQELNDLRKQEYQGKNLVKESKFSHDSFKEKMPVIFKIQEFLSRQLLSKVSKKVNSAVTLSDSLDQLAEISKSVDELIDMNVPYGERTQNYEKLTQYLNQANIIHSKISKSLNK